MGYDLGGVAISSWARTGGGTQGSTSLRRTIYVIIGNTQRGWPQAPCPPGVVVDRGTATRSSL